MRHIARSLWRNVTGAVAPTVALSLTALIAAGGIAFDYSRLASMDTELQQAADQAALAGATQLDGQNGATNRAVAAAQSLLVNKTVFSNDSCSTGTTIETGVTDSSCGSSTVRITFYSTKADAEAGTNGYPASGAADVTAKFIGVDVVGRQAVYALTPIVAAFSSPTINANAVAGLGSAICKVPPVMICNPEEPTGNTNVDYPFDADSYKGDGIRLVGDGSYQPGNWGFLQTGFGSGANALLKALGYNSPPGDCIPETGVTTQTGVDASVMDGINTRFDVNANGNSCPGGDVNCSPSLNVRKDLVRGNQCGITGNGWQMNASNSTNFQSRNYRPTSAAVLPSTVTPEAMGYPRDLCAAWSENGNCTGSSNGRIGDGQWDINAYWRSTYGTNYAGEVSAATYGSQPQGYPTRYQVYQWETDNYATKLLPKAMSTGGNTAYPRPVAGMCLATSTSPYGIVPGDDVVDRRRISAAVLNCQALNIQGHETDEPVLKWVDMFLVEPSYSRTTCTTGSGCNTKYTDKTDIYAEIIGVTPSGKNGSTNGQVVKREVPYLIR